MGHRIISQQSGPHVQWGVLCGQNIVQCSILAYEYAVCQVHTMTFALMMSSWNMPTGK